MTCLRLFFAGYIKKVTHKEVKGKKLCELSVVRMHRGREGAEDNFTWANIAIWEPAEWMVPKLLKNAFIAGSGDAQLRSYEKDGAKRQSLDVRCNSFDVEVGPVMEPEGEPAARPPRPAAQATAASANDDDPPF